MSQRIPISWAEANQSYLVMEFARLRRRFAAEDESTDEKFDEEALRASLDPAAAIDRLATVFGLSAFERDVVLLAAGVEMDSRLAQHVGEALGREPRGAITFALALATLAEAHWSALAPTAPLRRYRLVELEADRGLTTAALRIDERILHYLVGVNVLDPRLEPLLQFKGHPHAIAEQHRVLAVETIAGFDPGSEQQPVLHLCGDDPRGQEDIASLWAVNAGRHLYVLRAENIPAAGAETDQLVALWTREAALLPAVLLVQCGSATLAAAARQVLERLPAPLVLASREPMRLERPLLRYDVDKPEPAEQKHLWKQALGAAAEGQDELLDDVAVQFRLSAEMIASLGTAALADDGVVDAAKLWSVCRSLARPRLEDLAQRIEPVAAWSDLILPDAQMNVLRQLAAQARHRMTVYETWGFAERGRRGLGISALFSGPSGTGKTLAAEVVANALKLDLYRIDLATVVSKYIGETEKNLKQVFDAAEEGGVILLFDEADALFGKRGEVKDSVDRYANIEVGYLLQRMESFQGLAILTTNLKSSLDKAFQRRLRFTVDFPFPDAAQRQAIWQRIFPEKTPTEKLDAKLLAQLNMVGGNLRNIAVNAAFLAAEAGGKVSMEHVLEATRLEAVKVERPLSATETRGWV
jgi:ATPase family associated with various cellular activities (AAA)